MKASLLVKQNIDALLRRDHLSRKDLAQWCRRSESWISKIYKEDRREFPMNKLDRIADLFGMQTYQLFQPGLRGTMERRAGLDRRSKNERRTGHDKRMLGALAVAIDAAHPRRGQPHATPAVSKATADARVLVAEFERRLAVLLAQTDVGGQTSTPRTTVPKARKSTGTTGRSDPHESEKD